MKSRSFMREILLDFHVDDAAILAAAFSGCSLLVFHCCFYGKSWDGLLSVCAVTAVEEINDAGPSKHLCQRDHFLRGVFFNGQGGRFRPILEMAEIFFGESSGPKTT